jgi:hypothetical protein
MIALQPQAPVRQPLQALFGTLCVAKQQLYHPLFDQTCP